MRIRRTFLWQLRNSDLLKAVALLLFYKNKYKSSTIKDYTRDKIHRETGLHSTTIKKRIATLKQYGLITINNGHLTFLSVSSSNDKRNVNILCENLSVKQIEKSLQATIFMEIQRRKDFAKHTIQVAYNPPKYTKMDVVKKARKLCIQYGYNKEYREFGLSYKTIARKLNISLQTAFKVVAFAVKHSLVEKVNNIKQVFAKGIGSAKKFILDGVCNVFTTKNNIYLAYANTYSIVVD